MTKWCRIEVAGRPFYAAVDGKDLVALEGEPFADHKRTAARYPLSGAKLLAPVQPSNFYAAGLNFASHIEWANKHHGKSLPMPKQADIGYQILGETILPNQH